MGSSKGRVSLAESFRHCRAVTRARARNFYYAFRLLDDARRDAICSIYAFMRQCDDLSDEAGATVTGLEAWRAAMRSALDGGVAEDPLWPAFVDTVERYRIPHHYFEDHIDGVASDLARSTFETFDELYRYCYQVASIPGLALVHVFGYRTPEALDLAEKCGVAFQLTNIIRDVREDADKGRVYLPREDLDAYGADPSGFGGGRESGRFRELLRYEGRRAHEYYRQSRPLLDMVDPACRPSLWALIEIYSRLLKRIESRNYDVLGRRVRVSAIEKSWIVVRALMKWTS